MSERPSIRCVVHIDVDDPRVIMRSEDSFWLVPEEGDPDAPGVFPLESEGWRSVGFTLDAASPETLALAFGADPGAASPRAAMTVRSVHMAAPAAPRKRRGLTGKRYRIARRGYAREMRAWRRGEGGTPVETVRYLPNVRPVDATLDLQRFVIGAVSAPSVLFRPSDHRPTER